MINLIQFTDNDRQLLIAIFLTVILLFVIVGYLSLLVKKIMNFQSKTADDFLHDVYVTGTITSEKKLRRYGLKKNKIVLFKQAKWPMIILAITWLFIITFIILFRNGDFKLVFSSFWDYGNLVEEGGKSVGGTGINTLFYVFDWSTSSKITVLGGIKLPTQPAALNFPHFSGQAWYSYIFFTGNLVGLIWMLVCVQAYMARSFRVIKLSSLLFKKTLDDKPMPLNNNTTVVPPSETNNQ